jgi:hypothetical protein
LINRANVTFQEKGSQAGVVAEGISAHFPLDANPVSPSAARYLCKKICTFCGLFFAQNQQMSIRIFRASNALDGRKSDENENDA